MKTCVVLAATLLYFCIIKNAFCASLRARKNFADTVDVVQISLGKSKAAVDKVRSDSGLLLSLTKARTLLGLNLNMTRITTIGNFIQRGLNSSVPNIGAITVTNNLNHLTGIVRGAYALIDRVNASSAQELQPNMTRIQEKVNSVVHFVNKGRLLKAPLQDTLPDSTYYSLSSIFRKSTRVMNALIRKSMDSMMARSELFLVYDFLDSTTLRMEQASLENIVRTYNVSVAKSRVKMVRSLRKDIRKTEKIRRKVDNSYWKKFKYFDTISNEVKRYSGTQEKSLQIKTSKIKKKGKRLAKQITETVENTCNSMVDAFKQNIPAYFEDVSVFGLTTTTDVSRTLKLNRDKLQECVPEILADIKVAVNNASVDIRPCSQTVLETFSNHTDEAVHSFTDAYEKMVKGMKSCSNNEEPEENYANCLQNTFDQHLSTLDTNFNHIESKINQNAVLEVVKDCAKPVQDRAQSKIQNLYKEYEECMGLV